jgi:Predicted DNA binding protein
MGVIIELSIPTPEFQMGRILSVEGDVTITLETLVPLGGQPVPFFRVSGNVSDSFESQVQQHSAVDDIEVVKPNDGDTLYALDWELDDDTFLHTISSLEGHILEASGESGAWVFQIRFGTQDSLSKFQETCFDEDIPIDITRIFNPTKPDAGPWYGLTASQRETLRFAVEEGYYSIPRRTSTIDVAEEFDISDQAATERLRRAINTLVSNTLLLTHGDDT